MSLGPCTLAFIFRAFCKAHALPSRVDRYLICFLLSKRSRLLDKSVVASAASFYQITPPGAVPPSSSGLVSSPTSFFPSIETSFFLTAFALFGGRGRVGSSSRDQLRTHSSPSTIRLKLSPCCSPEFPPGVSLYYLFSADSNRVPLFRARLSRC